MNSSFNSHHRRDEAWFSRHEAASLSELLAVRALLPWEVRGLEIGVGTGRFAAPLALRSESTTLFVMVFLISKYCENRFCNFSKFHFTAKSLNRPNNITI